MKHFLLPTDFSENAFNAELYALEWAKEFKSEITLLNVYHIPNPLQTLPIEIIVAPDELKSETESVLKEERKKLLEIKPYLINIECMSRNGFAEKEINDAAKFLDVDLIVLGMRGGGALTKAIFGSVATSVISKAIKPVLLVPRNVIFKKPVNILLTIDEKALKNEAGLELIKSIAVHFKSTVHIVNIHPSRDFVDKDEIAERIANYFVNVKSEFNFLESDRVNEKISSYVQENNIDLMVMFPHHHSLLFKLFGGSHTQQVASHSTIPLLTIPGN
jgi:nucleotide-binding universal stress UspA family protein